MPAAARARNLNRVGGLFVASTLGITAVPIALSVWFLHESATSPLIAFAGGTAVAAIALQVIAAFARGTGTASALLVGADENGREVRGTDNPGAEHLQLADLLRRGPGRAVTLLALATAVVALGIRVGVPVYGGEGILVPVLLLAVAILTALTATLIPHRGRDGAERVMVRVAGLLPTLLAVAGSAAALALWIPSAYKNLRFSHVGMENFTDPAIAGTDSLPRTDLEPQIEAAIPDIGTYVGQTDESQAASAFLDVLALYGIHPNTLIAIAVAVGGVATVLVQVLFARILSRRSATTLRIARTSRTGGALGSVAALGASTLATAGVLGIAALVLVVFAVVGEGVPDLVMSLLAFAAGGSLLVLAGSAALHTGELLTEMPRTDETWQDAARGGASETAGGIQLALALVAASALSPIIGAITAAGRASTVWEDRALHLLSFQSLSVLGGAALAILSLALLAAGMAGGIRRMAAASVVDTRASLLDGNGTVSMGGLGLVARRAGLFPVSVVLLMPLVAGYALGPTAVTAYVGTLVVAGLALAVLSTVWAGVGRSALEVITGGRYGGPGSWGHSGALGTATLGSSLSGMFGTLASLSALGGTLVGVLTVSSAVNMMVDGTNQYLRWGAAVIALLVIGACAIYAMTAEEVDLEDELAEDSGPLFARNVDEEDSIEGSILEDWADRADDDEDVEEVPLEDADDLGDPGDEEVDDSESGDSDGGGRDGEGGDGEQASRASSPTVPRAQRKRNRSRSRRKR
jgi:hypothetical protein